MNVESVKDETQEISLYSITPSFLKLLFVNIIITNFIDKVTAYKVCMRECVHVCLCVRVRVSIKCVCLDGYACAAMCL